MANFDDKYEFISGGLFYSVPKALENGGSFLTGPEVIDKKINVMMSKDKEAINFWFETNFWVKTPIFYHTNGNILIGDVKDSRIMEYLKKITSDMGGVLDERTYRGRLVLPDNFKLTEVCGDIFTRKHIRQYGEKSQKEEDAKKNPFLFALADHDKDRLEQWIETTYKLARDKFGKSDLMSVWFADNGYVGKNNLGLFSFDGVDKWGYGKTASIGAGVSSPDKTFLVKIR